MMSEPKVSVCIPTFNRVLYLRNSVESVLAQSFQNYELVIVDNGSTDGTADLVRSFNDSRIRYIRNPENIGMVPNLNKCLEVARSEYVIIFHDDDLMKPDLLRKEVEVLDAHPEVVFVHAQSEVIDAEGRREGFSPQAWPPLTSGNEFIRLYWLPRHLVVFSSVIMRKSVAHRVGGFDPRFIATCDAELWQRIALEGSVAFLSEVLLAYRIHSQQGAVPIIVDGCQMLEEEQRYAEATRKLGERIGIKLDGIIAKGWSHKICGDLVNLRGWGGSRRQIFQYARAAYKMHPVVAREPRFGACLALAIFPPGAVRAARKFRWACLTALVNAKRWGRSFLHPHKHS